MYPQKMSHVYIYIITWKMNMSIYCKLLAFLSYFKSEILSENVHSLRNKY
jgi:hypothetical protein